jgi:hypothetical protein
LTCQLLGKKIERTKREIKEKKQESFEKPHVKKTSQKKNDSANGTGTGHGRMGGQMHMQEIVPNNILFVNNLSESVNETILRNVFSNLLGFMYFCFNIGI